MEINFDQLIELYKVVNADATSIELEKEGEILRVRVEYGFDKIDNFKINEEGECMG